MRVRTKIKYERFWLIYFLIRGFFYLFDIFVYSRLSTLGDTARYLSGTVPTDGHPFLNSTAMMNTLGVILGKLSLGIDLIANLPCYIISCLVIKWAIEKTHIREYVNPWLLLCILSIPNFCIWTCIFSKEFVGLVICAVFGVLFYNFYRGDFKLHFRDYFALYLCILFKPQYLPFIFQGLFMIYVCKKIIKKPYVQTMLGLSMLLINISIVIALSPIINDLSYLMYIHFSGTGNSTRPNIFLKDGDFFRHIPDGMLQAFIGPNLKEMLSNPLMLIAGLEGIGIVFTLIWLSQKAIIRMMRSAKISPVPFFSILITTIGIMFMHYPFGIFNPGSAIRYRSNFIFLFIMLFIFFYRFYKKGKIRESYSFTHKKFNDNITA